MEQWILSCLFNGAASTSVKAAAGTSRGPSTHWAIATIITVPDHVSIAGSAAMLGVHVMIGDYGRGRTVDDTVHIRTIV